MNQKIELRFNEPSIESVDEGLKVSGYVNKTESWSLPLGTSNRFIEKIPKGVFQRALEEGNEINFLAEHDKSKILASTKNGSLELREDENGLFMSATISPTSWGKDYHQLIKDGLIQNMSFGMQVLEDKWDKGKQYAERTIEKLKLFEVSAVKNPAYIESTITARSIDVVSADELFLMQKNKTNNPSEENKMNLKQITEQRALLDAQEAELRGEAVQTVETRAGVQNTLSTEEFETRAVEQFLRGQEGKELKELRAVTTTSNTGNGTNNVTIPTHLSNIIIEKLGEYAPLFSRTKNFTPVAGTLEVLREQTIGTAGFVGEMNAKSMTSDFTMDKVRLDQKRVGTAIELSQHLVNDSGIDVVGYAINILSKRLGLTLDDAILNGDKATQFEGIVLDAGNVVPKYETEAVGAISVDDLLGMTLSINPEYLHGAVFVVARTTFNEIAKMKNGKTDEYYLVRDVATTGVTYSLFGVPVIINDNMPPFGTPGVANVALVNFGEAYATMTKKGLNLRHISDDTTQALRGSHLLLLDGYMDGKILNPDAARLLLLKSA